MKNIGAANWVIFWKIGFIAFLCDNFKILVRQQPCCRTWSYATARIHDFCMFCMKHSVFRLPLCPFCQLSMRLMKMDSQKKSITHHAPEHCRLTISAFTYKESLIKDCTKGAVLDVIYILLRLRFRKSFCNSKKINLGIKTQEKKVFHTGLKVILSC